MDKNVKWFKTMPGPSSPNNQQESQANINSSHGTSKLILQYVHTSTFVSKHLTLYIRVVGHLTVDSFCFIDQGNNFMLSQFFKQLTV